MFVTVQIPVVDLRPLIAAPTGRDELPLWPKPDRVYARWSADHHRSNYVRGLGPVRPRLKGGAAPWLSESVYIDVSRNVRMQRSPFGPSWKHWAEWTTMRPVYRNFYTDGVVGRFEACLKISTFPRGVGMWRVRELLEEAASSAPVWLRGHSTRRRPLAQFGPELTRHLLRCTTGATVRYPLSWWMQAATPAVISEIPSEDSRVEDPAGYLQQHWVLQRGVRMSSWTLKQGSDSDAARRLRIHVSRLHADFMAAEIVAGLCQGGQLDPDHPPVRGYLGRTIDLLLRPARHGFSQADLLVKVLSGNTEAAYAGTFAALKRLDHLAEDSGRIGELLSGVKPTKRDGLSISVRELFMAKNETTINGGTFHGSVSTGEGEATTTINNVPADLAPLLAALTMAVAKLAATLPPEQAAAVEDAADGVAREAGREVAVRNKPGLAARLKSLTEIATGAGTAGAALGAAVTALRAAFGL